MNRASCMSTMQFRKTGSRPSLVTRLFRTQRVRHGAALIVLSSWSTSASGATVSVSGATGMVGLQVLETRDRLTVSGILQDDARQPVPAVPLQVALSGHSAEMRFFPRSPAGPPPVHALEAQTLLESDGERNTALLETDRLGRFCVALDKTAQGAQLVFHFAGSEHLLPSESALSLTPKANQVLLSFIAGDLRVALNRTPLVVQVDTRASQPAPPRTDLDLALAHRFQHTPATGRGGQHGGWASRVLPVTPQQLGSPGLGELRARFEGDDQQCVRDYRQADQDRFGESDPGTSPYRV